MPQNAAGVGIPDILEAVRRQWRLGVIVFAATFIGVFVYAHSLPQEFTAKAIVALTPRPGVGVGAVDVTQLGQKYVAFVTSPTTVGATAAEVGLDRSTLADGVSADIATSSVNLSISVRLRSARLATEAANSLADAAVGLASSDKLLTADPVVRATVPTAPSRPRRHLIEGIGLVVALILAIVAAVLVERGRPRVRSSAEVAFVTGHGVIGRVPTSRSVRGGVDRALADPLVGGAIRSLRTVLDHEARSSPVHTLVITSSVPGEGKSTVAASLASAIARLDARVLLVDADLRHPTVASLFGIDQKPGLAELLRNEVEFPAAVSAIRNIPGLYVVPTSGIVDTGDLLARNLHAVLQRARSGFDVVIVDSPPLLAGDDSGTIATQADAVLLVVASGVETRRLGEAARILDTVGVRVIGALLNRAPVPTFGYTYRATGAEGRSSSS